MGINYIPRRIDAGKMFGMIWIILEKSDLDIEWLTCLLETTTIPVKAYFNPGVTYVKCDQFEKAEDAFEQMLYDKHNANQVELIYNHYGMAQLLYLRGEKTKAKESNLKAIRLIDSREPVIGIQEEVEQLAMVIKENA